MMRQSRERQNYLNKKGVERGNMGKNIVHKLKWGVLTAAFCMVLSLSFSMVCFADEEGIVLGDSCNIRATTDTNGTVIGNAKKNQTISIISEVTGNDGKTWYQVWVDASTKGYIRADLVQKSSSSTTTTTATTNLPETQVTAVTEQTATVITNNVNIRKGAGTAYGAVATANKGMTLTVTGEASASNGQKWYQVKFTYNSKEVTGFIRSDLVTFGTVNTTEVSEITGSEVTEEPETEAPTETETQTEQETVPEEETQAETENNSSSEMILMNVTEVPYIMPGFEQIILKWEDQDINAYKNGDFYIFYAQKQSGEEGWYVFDSTNGTYQRYAYAVDGVSTGSDGSLLSGVAPIIILVVIIVILLAVVGLMFIRLREYTSEEYEEEDEEEDEDEDEEADEESEEEETVSQRPRNPRRPQNAPVYEEAVPRREQVEERRVEPERQVRRSIPEGQRPVRRPNSAQRPEEAVQRPEGQRPVRRPGNGQRPEGAASGKRENDRPVRNQNTEATRRRPSGEPVQKKTVRQPQSQQGYRAQNFLEKDDQDDIEFIDL